MTWTPPAAWSVPQEWVPESRCLIICGGESVLPQIPLIQRFAGRVIAIKEAVRLRPDADVMFISGERTGDLSLRLLREFAGRHVVTRGRSDPAFPPVVKRVGRSKDHDRLCLQPNMVAGWDGGTSAINLAYHLGAREVVLVGYDMTGGRWMNLDRRFKDLAKPAPSKAAHLQHLSTLPAFAADCRRHGLRVVNCSRRSAATCFDYLPLERFV